MVRSPVIEAKVLVRGHFWITRRIKNILEFKEMLMKDGIGTESVWYPPHSISRVDFKILTDEYWVT